jgi:acyl-coenzyme A thioesterase PaaI-like protein
MTDKAAEQLKSSGWTIVDTTGFLSLVDRSCGMTARYVSGRPTLATVQLDTHFVDSGKIGDILISRPRVVRSTRSLIFVTTEVTADKRCIVMASGVFKILKND